VICEFTVSKGCRAGDLGSVAHQLEIGPRAGQATYVYVDANGRPLHKGTKGLLRLVVAQIKLAPEELSVEIVYQAPGPNF